MNKMHGCAIIPEIAKENDYITLQHYVNRSLVPWADVSLDVIQVKKEMPPELPRLSNPHTHEMIETYAVVGNLTIEADIEGEKYVISAPGAIVIPPGVKRYWRFVKGTGYLMVTKTIRKPD